MRPVIVVVADVFGHEAFEMLSLAKITSGPRRARSLRLKGRANRRMKGVARQNSIRTKMSEVFTVRSATDCLWEGLLTVGVWDFC